MPAFTSALRYGLQLVILCLVVCLMGGNMSAVAQTAEQTLNISIPAGDLADALDKLGAQSGVQIMYEPVLVAGIRVAAVSGRLTVSDALAKLLAQTGLNATRVNDKTVVLKRTELRRTSDRNERREPVSAVVVREGTELEEVVVTARRREENAQSVPVAITAV